jgi:hypothetical protein
VTLFWTNYGLTGAMLVGDKFPYASWRDLVLDLRCKFTPSTASDYRQAGPTAKPGGVCAVATGDPSSWPETVIYNPFLAMIMKAA